MEIIKTIQHLTKVHPSGLDREWGLGDDGELYVRLANPRNASWSAPWEKYVEMDFGITLREMREIVKQFGHLVIFT